MGAKKYPNNSRLGLPGFKEACANNGNHPHKSGDLATRTTHGFYSLRKAIHRKIDMRSALGKALAQWKSDLIADLGGQDNISTQQLAIIDLSARNKIMLDSIDAWLFDQPSLVLIKKRVLLPVVKERQALADGLAKYLAMLGLERRSKQLSLAEIKAEILAESEEDQE